MVQGRRLPLFCSSQKFRNIWAVQALIRSSTLPALYLQHPSMAIVKGAGLVMKAIIEEGDSETAARMQELALAEVSVRVLVVVNSSRLNMDQALCVYRTTSTPNIL